MSMLPEPQPPDLSRDLGKPRNCYPVEKFPTGAVRSKELAGSNRPCRYDLITPIGLRRLAETYGEGSVKYGDRNWEKGIPNENLLNHALAHIAQYMAGDNNEDHLAHAAWNIFALMHFEEAETCCPSTDDARAMDEYNHVYPKSGR